MSLEKRDVAGNLLLQELRRLAQAENVLFSAVHIPRANVK